MSTTLLRGRLQATRVPGAFPHGPAVARTAVHAATFRRSTNIAKAVAFDINQFYVLKPEVIQPYIGPVKAVRLKGGRGLETSKTLQAGETLLVSTPLALVTHTAEETDEAAAAAAVEGEVSDLDGQYEPTDEDIDGLADQLLNRSDPRTAGWLRYLDDGSIDSNKAAQLPDLQALAQNPSSSSSSRSDSSSNPAAAADLDEDTLLDLADINTRVLFEDDALVMLRSDSNTPGSVTSGNNIAEDNMSFPEPKTLVGVWPELALIPHSCCPNATVVAVDPAAIITASRNIPKEGVVFQNILGPLVLAPLKERRAAVERMTGLKCMCPRCRDEEKQDQNLLQLIDDIYEACTQQIGPELEAAVENDDDQTLDSLCDQLGAYCEVVDAGFSKMAVKQQTQIWLQASLFKLYELTAIASAAAADEPDARSMELLAALAAEVCPGSSEHLFWAQQYRSIIAADQESYFDGALRQAETMVMNAYKMRYGNISRALYQKMQDQQQQLEAAAEPEYGDGEQQ